MMNLLTASRDSKNIIERACGCIQNRAPLQGKNRSDKGNINVVNKKQNLKGRST